MPFTIESIKNKYLGINLRKWKSSTMKIASVWKTDIEKWGGKGGKKMKTELK